MRYLDAAGVRQLKELNDAAYVGKEEYNDDTMVISAALNDLNGRITTAESEIAGFSGGDENIIETVKVNGTALTVTDKAVDVTVPTTLASLTDDSTHRLVTDTEKTTWSGKANTASPAFTGTPTAPTAAAGTNTTQIATTAFVQNAVNSASAYEYFVNLDLGTISSFNGVYVQDLQFEDANGNTVYPSMYDTDSPTKPIYVTFTYSIPGEDPMGRDTVSGTEGILFTEFAWDDSYVYTSGSAMAYSIVEGLNGYDYVLQDSNGDWSFSIQKHVEYSSYEKTKLQGIAAGAEVNVQSDWSVTDSTSDAYIANKPTIPTKVSDLTNDSGFTTNTGTITGVTMNGVSKGTSGVVDLGTVITDVSGKADSSAAIGTLSLAIDNTNYQITLSGTKVDGTTFTVSNVIDLPLESVVVNGSYNNTTKKVVLTLQNGNTVDFSVADLVAGLQSEITSTNKLSADLISDGTTNKVVTATEKNTWNAKADTASPTFTGTPTAPTATAGTNNTQIATTAFVTNAITSSSNKGTLEPSIFGSFSFSGSTLADVPTGSATVNAVDKTGNNISSSDIGDYYDGASSKYPIIQIDVTVEGTSSSDPGYTTTLLFTEFSNTVSNGLSYIGDFLQSGEIIADDSNGLYYFYIILDLNDTNIKINLHKRTVNADWNATYGASKILNKPTIPTKVSDLTNDSGFITGYTETDPVFSASAAHDITSTDISNWNSKQAALNAGTFNVLQNGVTAGSYSINQSGNSSANIIVPTKVSDLTNDSGFTSNTGTITSVKMNGTTVSSSGEADLGTVITAHATRKLTATNSTATAGGSTITYVESLTGTNTATSGDLTVTATRKTVTIPSAPGTLKTNNTTAQTASASESLSGTINLHKVAKTGTYSDLIGTPTIPTVNNSTISIQKGGTAVDSFTTNAASAKTINIPNELPSYSSSDSGKILSVNSSGALVWITPSYIYSGSSAPSNSTGNNGDLYLQTS